jgi:hypothetical protein
MEVPALAINGNVPVVSPVLIGFVLITLAGGAMLIAALLKRNFLLVADKRLNPFRPSDLIKAGDPSFSMRKPGALPFNRTRYARTAIGLLAVGSVGTTAMLLWQLFVGQ